MDGTTAQSAGARIQRSLDELVELALKCQRSRWPELADHADAGLLAATARDTRYHLEFIASALRFEEKALLDDYLVWCKVLFTNLGLPIEWVEGSLRCIAETFEGRLPAAEVLQARSYVESALRAMASADVATADCAVAPDALGVLAQRYLHTVLNADRDGAVALLESAVASGTPVRDIYTHVLGPVQREVGRLWLVNKLSVAQEHYITETTRFSMARLYHRHPDSAAHDRSVVVACVGDELHELGPRMVADFFQMDGWDTHYLGANTPTAAIVEAVKRTRTDALALSATMAFHVKEIADIISMVRADPETASVFVLAGGYPFDVAPDLWVRVGADGTAPDAESAVRLANKLMVTFHQV